MPIVYINIGSNLGDRKGAIQKALHRIGDYFGYYCISEIVESEPWGFDSTNSFMNIGVAFKTSLSPEEVLDILQQIEKEISTVSHRDEFGNYKDREIDIDIMAIEGVRMTSERLSLPHPHLHERPFFIGPLKELTVANVNPQKGSGSM